MFFKKALKKCPNCGAMNPEENSMCSSCGAILRLGQVPIPLVSSRTSSQVTSQPRETEVEAYVQQPAFTQPVKYLPNKLGRIDLTRGSLVIEEPGSVFTRVFKKGSRPPLICKVLLSTVMDNQQIMEVRFSFALTKNYHAGKPLARLLLTRIEKAAQGVPQIEVAVSVDQGGEVAVSAIDKRTSALRPQHQHA